MKLEHGEQRTQRDGRRFFVRFALIFAALIAGVVLAISVAALGLVSLTTIVSREGTQPHSVEQRVTPVPPASPTIQPATPVPTVGGAVPSGNTPTVPATSIVPTLTARWCCSPRRRRRGSSDRL